MTGNTHFRPYEQHSGVLSTSYKATIDSVLGKLKDFYCLFQALIFCFPHFLLTISVGVTLFDTTSMGTGFNSVWLDFIKVLLISGSDFYSASDLGYGICHLYTVNC